MKTNCLRTPMEAKQIPLVIYRRGVRTEIGMARVEDDGSIVAQVSKDNWPLVKELFMPNVGEFSINPVPAKLVDLKYNTHPNI